MDQKLTYEELKQKNQHLEDTVKVHQNKELSLLKKIGELEEISKYYYALMENTEDAILISDKHGKPQAFNSSYKRKIKELLNLDMRPGIQPHTLLNDTDAKKYWDSLHQRVLAGEEFRSEYSHAINDDLAVHFETTFCPIVEGSEITGFTEISRDISDRKQAEEALRESEEHLKRIFDTAPGGIVVVDHTGKIITVNTAAEKILGLTISTDIENAYNDPAPKITAMDGGPSPVEDLPFVHVMKNGTPVHSIEHTIEHPDGRRVILSINGVPFKDASGNIAGMVAGITDITERKQAEERLLYDKTLLRHVLDTSPAVIFVKDYDSTILLANKKMASFYNLSVEQVTGRRQSDLHAALGVRQQEVENWLADDREVIVNGIIKHLLETGTDSNSRVLWFETDKYPIDIGEGRQGVLVISSDITERKQAEETLRKSEQKYRNLVESTDDWVWACDLEGRQTFANETVRNILGYELHEIIGISSDTFVHSEDAKRIKKWFKRAVAEKRGWKNNVARWQHKNGTIRFLESSGKPILDFQGDLVGFIGIDRDITERIKLEEQFLQTQKMEAMGTLAGGVAHDFNNILSIVFGNVDLMLMELEESHPFHKRLMQIKDSATVAATLTNQLLALSRKQLIQPKIMNLNDVINITTKLLGRLIGENITLQTSFDPALKPVKAESGQIEQVIINLAVNARDAMPVGGRLTIETKNLDLNEEDFQNKGIKGVNGPHVMLRVSDTGTGMTEEILSHVFDPFYTTKEVGKGTGLGLSTVYGIVKQNNGHIFVESEPDIGSAFEIYLPAGKEIEMPNTAELITEPDLSGSETILVVEDEIELLDVTSGILERYGYRVIQASNGNEALSVSNTHGGPIDLILSDVIMPGMDVREMVEKIQSRRKEIKILYVSGYTDDTISKYGILESGIDFMQKPYTPERLAGKVREMLDQD